MRLPAILPLLAAAAAVTFAATPAQAASCVGEQSAGTTKLEIIATDLRNGDGEVAFTVYPDERRRFLASGAKLARDRVPTVAPATTACFWLPPGHYAVANYHDENGDRKFNRTLFSIKEGFGVSNDAPTTLGLPTFEAARFHLPAEGLTMRIRTRYSR